jgi:hypothetical protein
MTKGAQAQVLPLVTLQDLPVPVLRREGRNSHNARARLIALHTAALVDYFNVENQVSTSLRA